MPHPLCMGALTEQEIFDCMVDNFRVAAQCCDDLAASPVTGPPYNRLRQALGLIEGACRQAAAWRQDSRWYPLGLKMAEAHKRAGDWLRGARDKKTNMPIRLAPDHRRRCFTMLAANLRAGEKMARDLKTRATGTIGPILPEPYRIIRPMQKTKSGLILPAGMQ